MAEDEKPLEVNNPLGRDEEEQETPLASLDESESPAEEPTEPEAPTPEIPQQTVNWEAKAQELQKQLDEAADAVSFYNQVQNDPGATDVIVNYYREQGAVQEETPAEPGYDSLVKEIQTLKQQQQVLQTAMAIKEWATDKPGFKEAAPRMQELMQKHPTLTLEEAWTMVSAGQAPPQPKPELQTSETRGVPSPRPSGDAALDEALSQIDRAADMGEAVKIALAHAEKGVRPK